MSNSVIRADPPPQKYDFAGSAAAVRSGEVAVAVGAGVGVATGGTVAVGVGSGTRVAVGDGLGATALAAARGAVMVGGDGDGIDFAGVAVIAADCSGAGGEMADTTGDSGVP
ncbi:MAG TPA: hypothetical protein QGH28_05495 [Chloroflexota bacterium]|nr:hypothetical protein [Chloroflexota bacterium]